MTPEIALLAGVVIALAVVLAGALSWWLHRPR